MTASATRVPPDVPVKPDTQAALSADESAWIAAHPVIDVGIFAGNHFPIEAWVAGGAPKASAWNTPSCWRAASG